MQTPNGWKTLPAAITKAITTNSIRTGNFPLMDIVNTDPSFGVFIIESMDIDNELEGNLDGAVLKKMLDLCHIPNKYFYIRTVFELEEIIKLYSQSGFGFLHLACHGNEQELGLTLEYIDFSELELIIGKHLYHRRLFLSACKATRFELAKHFIPKYHCYSVVGSPDNIEVDKAAVFWSSFYYLMYNLNSSEMPQREIMPILESVTKTFSVKLNYYSIIKNDHPNSIDHLREIKYDSGQFISTILDSGFKNFYR